LLFLCCKKKVNACAASYVIKQSREEKGKD